MGVPCFPFAILRVVTIGLTALRDIFDRKSKQGHLFPYRTIARQKYLWAAAIRPTLRARKDKDTGESSGGSDGD